MSNETLQPVEQKNVFFYDDELVAVRTADDKVYAPLRPICERMGMSWQGQLDRVRRNPVLADELRSVSVTLTDREPGSSAPKTSTMLALPIDMLNGWLFGVSVSRVKPEIRENLIKYQRDCHRVLADAFGRNMVTAKPSAIDTATTPAALAYRNAIAVANIARQQYELEQRIDSAESRIDMIEATLANPSRFVTLDQAERVSAAVSSIAMAMSERSGRNEYGGIYGELHRRFKVPSYRELPAAKFDECINWLVAWYQQLTDTTDTPF